MQHPITGVPITDRKKNCSIFRECFIAREFIDYFSEEYGTTRDVALRIGKELLAKSYIVPLDEHVKFKDNDCFYAFQKESISGYSTKISSVRRKSNLIERLIGLREETQAELFTGHGEFLKIIISASTIRKGKDREKSSRNFLSVSLKGDRLQIHQIKKAHDTYSITKSWLGDELKLVEVQKYDEKAFTLAWDKNFYFKAKNSADKDIFLWVLLSLCKKYCRDIPQTNIDIFRLQMYVGEEVLEKFNFGSEAVGSYKDNMSIEEQEQLKKFFSDYNKQTASNTVSENELTVVSDVVKRANVKIQKEEAKNICDIIESHEQVKDIQNGLEKALMELETTNKNFESIQADLDKMFKYIRIIEKKNNHMRMVTDNHKQLYSTLDDLLRQIQLTPNTIEALKNPDFETPEGIRKCSRATKKLDISTTDFPDNMENMFAISGQQLAAYNKISTSFVTKFISYCDRYFTSLSRSHMKFIKSNRNKIGDHSNIHESLMKYSEIMHWLSSIVGEDQQSAEYLMERYQFYFSEVYKWEFKKLFKSFKKRVKKPKTDDEGIFSSGSGNLLPNMAIPMSRPNLVPHKSKAHLQITAPQAYRECLNLILPMILAEQDCGRKFFNLDSNDLVLFCSKLFDLLQQELNEVIDMAKEDKFYCLTFWNITTDFLMEYGSKSEYIEGILLDRHTFLRMRFMEFINQQKNSILQGGKSNVPHIHMVPNLKHELKGVLEPVLKFPSFIQKMENCGASEAGGSEGISDSAYTIIGDALLQWILSLGSENKNSQFILRIENFEMLQAVIHEHQNVACLQNIENRAKIGFDRAVDSLVHSLSRTHLSGLLEFFNKIDTALRTIRDIQFQKEFEKSILQKNIKKFGDLSKLEKHLFKELKNLHQDMTVERLIPHVWEAWKSDMIQKYTHFEEIIRRFYDVSLLFNSNELLEAFERSEEKWEQKQAKKAEN
eukprot:TRINITY_DN11585_c0_g1_i1.p1 TRINITY_DN11585_c0_g1~~TRINITY_DN11585_c0_g1_i1.p1  ORF type:complete len:989 (+),score=206.39 TRINITY_DN11585_c0_g1_i1:129-2969(+)